MEGKIIMSEEIKDARKSIHVVSFGQLGYYVFTESGERNFKPGDSFRYERNQWRLNNKIPVRLFDFNLLTPKKMNLLMSQLKKAG